jgi:folate-binding protein YgfZ
MTDPRNDVPPSGRLTHMGLVRFAGPDAGSFLQGQVSNDTRRLSAGSPLLAAYSTPQGRVVAVLHLLPHSSGLVALLPRDAVLPLIERLRKYVLRAKVQIEDLSGQFAVFGQYVASAAADLPVPDPAQGYIERDGIGVARVAADPSRVWVIGSVQDLVIHGLLETENTGANPNLNPRANTITTDPRDSPGADVNPGSGGANAGNGANTSANAGNGANTSADASAGTSITIGTITGAGGNAGAAPPARTQRVEQAWRLADIRCGLPQIYAATREMFVAQMLNLDLIDGISFTKGCFTGQEIVARTQHLGRIKRRLYRLRLPAGSWAIGQAVHLTDGRSGRLTEVIQLGPGAESLAVLNTEPSASATSTGEGDPAGDSTGARIDAAELPLPYPLANR